MNSNAIDHIERFERIMADKGYKSDFVLYANEHFLLSDRVGNLRTCLFEHFQEAVKKNSVPRKLSLFTYAHYENDRCYSRCFFNVTYDESGFHVRRMYITVDNINATQELFIDGNRNIPAMKDIIPLHRKMLFRQMYQLKTIKLLRR